MWRLRTLPRTPGRPAINHLRLCASATVGAVVLLACLSLPLEARYGAASAARNGKSILSTRIKSFHVTADSVSTALERLATEYAVPVGLEALPDSSKAATHSPIRVSVMDGTVREALDAILASDPRYTWDESGGVVNVLPRARRQSPLDIKLKEFRVVEVDRDRAVALLLHSPQIEHWLERNGLTRRDFVGVEPEASARLGRFSLDMKDAPAREILNAILTASGSHYWVYYRYGDRGQFFAVAMEDSPADRAD
jgi:hypothetical protein